MDFFKVEGEEIHEVAVGPVHAGIIEPGHFRFQCFGENVLNLEISLGYQHRGVERALIGGPDKRTLHYMQTLAGDTTIGHTTAYCQLMESLSGSNVSPRAQSLRGIALELERLRQSYRRPRRSCRGYRLSADSRLFAAGYAAIFSI